MNKSSTLQNLPAELRNIVYEHVADLVFDTLLLSQEEAGTIIKRQVPTALSSVSRQIRREFDAIYFNIPPALISHVTLLNEDFSCPRFLCAALNDIPAAHPDRGRTSLLQVTIRSDAKAAANLPDFIQNLVEFDSNKDSQSVQPPENDRNCPSLAEQLQYEVVVHASIPKLLHLRQHFARMHRRYQTSGAPTETERVVFGLVYRAFADAAYKTDMISVRDFSLGCWRWGDGNWGFV